MNEIYIRRCFQIAKLGLGNVKTNPIVGSVIVHQGQIIGEGYHQKYGEGHAEVNAIASVQSENRHLLKKSTIYVSLEPCFHVGKTPPCVNLILEHQIPKVVISLQDPSSKVGGKSIEKLRKHGVEVITDVLKEEGTFTIRRFSTHNKHKRPYIILKYAQSKDGFLSKKGEQVWLTNSFSKRLVHKWRSEEGAILIGKNTALIDNPNLTNRLYFGHSPIRIVIDRNCELPADLNIFNGEVLTIVVCEKAETLNLPNVEYLELDFNENLLIDLLQALYKKKIASLIVEGGAMTLQHFINENLWDEARIFTANQRIENGIAAPEFHSKSNHVEMIGNDELAYFYNKVG